MTNNRPDYSEAANAQAFFAKMAAMRGDEKSEKAHWDLALNYQRDHLNKIKRVLA